MSNGVVVWTGEPTGEERNVLLPVLLCFWAATFLLGIFLGWCYRGPSTPAGTRAVAAPIAAWEQLTRRAVFFIARRRRVSLAFGAYRDHPLRTGVAKPSPRPRRRSTTPGVLHEGFAVEHGSDRSRTHPDQQPRGGDELVGGGSRAAASAHGGFGSASTGA